MEIPDHRHRRVLRARRKRPRCRAAECGQQFPPSIRERHVPTSRARMPNRNDTMPRAAFRWRRMYCGRLEKFFSPSRYESDSLTAMGHGRIERASHGADGLFRC